MSVSSIVNTISVGSNPVSITGDTNYIWVCNTKGNSISQIQRSTGAVKMTVPMSSTSYLSGISDDGTYIWISDKNNNIVYQMTTSAVIINTIKVGTGPANLYSDGTNVWVPNANGGSVSQIQCSSAQVVKTIKIGNANNLNSCYSDGTYVWVCNAYTNQVVQIQCSTGTIVNTISLATQSLIPDSNGGMVAPSYVYSNGKYVWVSNMDGNSITQLDYSTGSMINNLPFSGGWGPGMIVGNGTYFWVTNLNGNNIMQYECSSGKQIGTIIVGSTPGSIYFDGTYLWVTVYPTNQVVQVQFSDPTSTGATGTTGSGPAPVPAPSPPPPPPTPYILTLNRCMTIWSGTSPSDITQYIWNPIGGMAQSNSNTGIPNLQPNPSYQASLGKTTDTWISSGFTLAKGDFIGNTDGSLYLIMNTDGNLNLCTTSYSYTSGVQLPGGMYAGASGQNAIYQFNEVGNPALINNIYFIDGNTFAYKYPSSYVSQGANYTQFSDLDTTGNDLGPTNNSSVSQCQSICDANTNCYGFVFDSNNTCRPKNSNMWPSGNNPVPTQGTNTYLKMNKLIKSPIGVTLDTINTNSFVTKSYPQASDGIYNAYGLTVYIQSELDKIQALEQSINEMAEEISNNNITIDNNQINIFNQANKDKKAIELFIDEYKLIEKQIEKVDSQEHMLVDTDIKVLQENYNYYLWTILAIGFVIVGIHVIKRKSLF